jgi:competence protein ComEA
MLKKILVLVTMLYATVCFAAVDVNKASAADLDAIKGIGPGISTKILDERKKGNFKDWNDFIERVKGVGEGNAAKFSAEGLTIGGAGFKGMAPAAAPAAKKDEKPAAKAEEKKAEAKPVAAAAAVTPAAVDLKADAKAAKEAAKQAKAEEKMKKADEAKAKKEAAKTAKDEKPTAKAEAAKPAASAAKK